MLRIFRPSTVYPLLALLAIAVASAQPAAAQSRQVETIRDKPTTEDGGRYSRRAEGWFWYVEEPEPDPVELLPPPPPKVVDASPDKPKPKPFSAEWIIEQVEESRMVALDNPTKDNMERYLLLQKLAIDRSEQFALAHRQYASLNPGIDETILNPVGGTSRMSVNRQQELGMEEVVRQIGDIAGIWYFYTSECPFCHQQNPTLNTLAHTGNFSILPISLDARSSTDGLLPNWRPDRGQAAMLGVQGTPTMYIVNPTTNQVILLASGVRTLPDLQRRIVEVARAETWITQDDYDRAMHGQPRRFITDGLDLDAEIEDDPDVILAMLREAAIHGQVQDAALSDIDQSSITPWSPTKASPQ